MNTQDFKAALLNSISERKTFEAAKNSENTSIQSTLDAHAKSVNHDAIAEILLLSAYDANSANRSERTNNKRNVYTLEKESNIARFLASVAALNHYTLAIFKAAHALEASEMKLSHKDAIAACSESCKHTDKKREKIIAAHRYAKHVAANTAATQSSSSINALQALNVLREERDASNVVVYSIDKTSHASQALAAKLSITL